MYVWNIFKIYINIIYLSISLFIFCLFYFLFFILKNNTSPYFFIKTRLLTLSFKVHAYIQGFSKDKMYPRFKCLLKRFMIWCTLLKHWLIFQMSGFNTVSNHLIWKCDTLSFLRQLIGCSQFRRINFTFKISWKNKSIGVRAGEHADI